MVTGLLLARGLGPDGYGIYGLAMSIIALVSVPAEFGLPQLVTREVAAARATGDWGRLSGVLRWADTVTGWASFALASMVGGTLLLRHGTSSGGLPSTLMWGVLLIPLVSLGKIRGAALRGLHHIVEGQVPDLALRPGILALLVAAAFVIMNWDIGPATAMSFHVAAAGSALVLAAFLLRRRMPEQVHGAQAVVERRQWLGSAFPLALTEGLRIAQGTAATIFLGMLSTATAVGLYRVADRGALLCAVPIALFNVISAPLVAGLYAKGEMAELQRMLGWISAAMFGGVLLLSVPFFVAGTGILEVLFGEDYRASLLPLWLLCGGQTVSAFAGINSTLLNMAGQERRVTRAFGLSLIANAAAASIAIPFLEETGAAIAWVVGTVIWNVLLWWDSFKILGVDTSVLSLALQNPPRGISR